MVETSGEACYRSSDEHHYMSGLLGTQFCAQSIVLVIPASNIIQHTGQYVFSIK
jgi:hypothetical protein